MKSALLKAATTLNFSSVNSWRSTPSTRAGGPFSAEILTDTPGLLCWRFLGSTATDSFSRESGGHRWQRVPPTEKRGRVQTSSVTVAVLPGDAGAISGVDRGDVSVDFYVGQGPGGQHRNKTATAARLVHIPTGIVACCENERSRHQNERYAWDVLCARVQQHLSAQQHGRVNGARREQIGTGYRGDKIRTVQEQNGKVTNHLTGRTCSLKTYLRGDLDAIR